MAECSLYSPCEGGRKILTPKSTFHSLRLNLLEPSLFDFFILVSCEWSSAAWRNCTSPSKMLRWCKLYSDYSGNTDQIYIGCGYEFCVNCLIGSSKSFRWAAQHIPTCYHFGYLLTWADHQLANCCYFFLISADQWRLSSQILFFNA